MPCSSLRINGMGVIVCGPKRIRGCVKCREIADRECDWKLPNGKTCDKPICAKCTVSPAPEKDLCPEHAAAWAKHPANPNRSAA